MIDRVSKFIEEYSLQNKTVLVGFSGGYDSMCLMDILKKISEKYNLRLIGIHFNHNWRGETAKKEQENCKEFCLKNEIEFYTETAPDDSKHNETEARELRYDFFERAYKKYNAAAVLTAHNFDDNAETVLYRIAKGTGIVGLKGILGNRGKYYRPLLNITRAEIERYCFENNLNPNFDNSNNDTVHKRNLIRHEIIPLLEQINPDVKKSLNALSKIAVSEQRIIDEYLDIISSKIFDNGKIKTKEFINLSAAVKQKIIYNLIYNSEYDYTMDTILNICDFIEETVKNNKPSKFSLSGDAWLYVDNNVIEIITKQEKQNISIEIERCGEYNTDIACFKIEKCDRFEKTKDETEAYIDISDYKNLTLRTRQDGDFIKPLGFSGRMKLKKYFMEKKIPQHRRDGYLLLTDKKEILWVAGLGLSDKIKVTDKPTHKVSVKYIN